MSISRSLRPGLGTLALVGVLLLVTAQAPAQAPLEPSSSQPPLEPSSSQPPVEPVDGEAEEELLDAETASYFASTLTLGAGRDDGFLAAVGAAVGAGEGAEEEAAIRELEDTVYTLRPALLLVHRPSQRTELVAAYEPELQFFDRHSELDAIDHAAGAVFGHALTRRSRLLAGGSLLDGEDPGRHLSGQLLVLPRVPYRQSRVYAGFERSWELTSLLLLVGRSATEIAAGAGVLAGGVDQSDNTASLTVGRTLGPRADLSLSYSYVDPDSTALAPVVEAPDEGEPDGGEAPEPALVRISDPIQTLSLGLGYRPTPRLSLQVTGGVLEERDDLTWVAAAEAARSGKAFAFRLRYDRSLLSLGPAAASAPGVPVQPLPPTAAVRDTVTQAVTASFAARPAERLRWEQSLWGARTSLPGDETLESLAVTSRLVLEVARRLGSFLEVQLLEQRGAEILGEPFTRTYVAVGLIVGLTGPAAAWGLREEPEALRRVLPNQRGVQ
ncbi:MAG TPA: hypothetical protein VM599_01225 [Thermoanaerobaculia bacterium]|nr:hypothetical protein [Thermoanaerobaculia bacterium]